MKIIYLILSAMLLATAGLSSQNTQAAPTAISVATDNPTLAATMSATASASTLRSLAESRNFYMGAAVNVDALLSVPQYSATLSQQYNMVVPENAMKWNATEPLEGVFTFDQADQLVDFAKANQMSIRGHNLVWHSQLPRWLTSGTFSHDQLLAILQKHIQGVVTRKSGQELGRHI